MVKTTFKTFVLFTGFVCSLASKALSQTVEYTFVFDFWPPSSMLILYGDNENIALSDYGESFKTVLAPGAEIVVTVNANYDTKNRTVTVGQSSQTISASSIASMP